MSDDFDDDDDNDFKMPEFEFMAVIWTDDNTDHINNLLSEKWIIANMTATQNERGQPIAFCQLERELPET